jgi:hypothetical protein
MATETTRSRRGRARESGSVLPIALLFALLAFGISLAVMWVSSHARRTQPRPNHRQDALFAAEAGLERARVILSRAADWNPALRGCDAASDGRKGVTLCDAHQGEPLPLVEIRAIDPWNRLPADGKGAGLEKIAYTVWVRNDWSVECDSPETDATQIDCDGDGKHDADDEALARTDTNGRVIVRSEGVGRDGLTTVVIEAIVGRPPKGEDGSARRGAPWIEAWREVPY